VSGDLIPFSDASRFGSAICVLIGAEDGFGVGFRNMVRGLLRISLIAEMFIGLSAQ